VYRQGFSYEVGDDDDACCGRRLTKKCSWSGKENKELMSKKNPVFRLLERCVVMGKSNKRV
jgi:hypothetical protein